MGERAKVILNEFSAKSMLMRDTVDLNKFYTADLKLMIEVAKQEIKKLQEEKDKEIERLNNIINKIEEHFVFLKMNSTGGNNEFFEDILDFIKALKELKGSD